MRSPHPASRVPRPLVLASASPRRRELLAALGVPFEVRAADIPEPLIPGVPAASQAKALALAKARADLTPRPPSLPGRGSQSDVRGRSLLQDPEPSSPFRVPGRGVGGERSLTLAADTIVLLDNAPLGKPAGAADARRMLRALRGRAHEVVTGVAITGGAGGGELTAHAVTRVHMRHYRDGEIETYIAGGDPLDKAGAYAIQHEQFRPVARIEGCYCNVMGLPLWIVRRLLARAAPHLATQPPDAAFARCATCPLRTGDAR